jgi:leucyl/phenylalanyl-tRNA---protein transferase
VAAQRRHADVVVPDPRAVLPMDGPHVSRTLRRTLARGVLRCTADTDFAGVVAGCADRPGEGSWITPALAAAYRELHAAGLAHSVEVRDAQGRLVGGVFGVQLGAAFMGESMFSRVSDASKVALVRLLARLRAGGVRLFDVQLPTAHLTSMGAISVPRRDYLRALAAARDIRAEFGPPGPLP